MPNNDNGQQRRNVLSGASVVVGAVGMLVGLAAAEHAQAQEENRESVVEGVGRWFRENLFDTPRSSARSSGSQVHPLPRRLSRVEVNTLPVRTITDGSSTPTPGNVSESTQAEATNNSGAIDNEKAFCVVCREHYAGGDQLLRLPCFHEFHSECIRDYLETTEGPLCPICRHPVTIG